MPRAMLLIMIFIAVLMSACGDVSPSTAEPASDTDAEPTEFIIDTPTPLPTFAPTLTPQFTDGLPSIELLSGSADTCSNAEAFTNVLSFEARQDEMTSVNFVEYRLLDASGNLLSEGDTPGENNDGEINWGFYPDTYDVDADSALVVEVRVYESDADDATLTSSSSLIYNCTTGETISSTIFRAEATE